MLNLEMYAVCATNGICEADPFADGKDNYPNGHIRCLCDDGWNGTVCAQQLNELTFRSIYSFYFRFAFPIHSQCRLILMFFIF